MVRLLLLSIQTLFLSINQTLQIDVGQCYMCYKHIDQKPK